MDVKQARVLIAVSEGRVEFEGSEEFVERQMTGLGDLVKESLRGALVTTKKPTTMHPAPVVPAPVAGNEGASAVVGLAGYEHLFAQNPKGKIQILKDLPGGNFATKMVNAALLLTLANTLVGRTATTFKEIREICELHGALDSKNFSAAIKAEISTFVFEGSPRSQSVSFTVPGKKAAEALAATLNQ
jgi:putative intracellular protease/amidase